MPCSWRLRPGGFRPAPPQGSATNSRLRFISRTGTALPEALSPTIADEFEISDQGIILRFLRNVRNEVTGFQLGGDGTHGIEFARIKSMANIPTTF